jgi:hypothetical protein
MGLRSGGHGGALLPVILLVLGGALGTAYSPVVTHALERVRPADAADASGLLTTSVQLGQVTGVATFGSLFLALAARAAGGAQTARRAAQAGLLPASPHAIAVTSGWLAALFAIAAVAALPLTVTVIRARRSAGQA